MEKPKLEPSLMRDALALLNEARKGDEWVTTHKLMERTGLGYLAARAKLLALVGEGYAVHEKIEGIDSYRGTDKAEGLLK